VLFGVSIGGLLAGSGAWGTARAVFGLAASVATLLVGADYLVRHAGVEYRIGDGSVVAHDTLFDTQLWRETNGRCVSNRVGSTDYWEPRRS